MVFNNIKKFLCLLCVLCGLCGSTSYANGTAVPAMPGSLDLTAVRAIPVLHSNRWQPLDTAARDIVEEVTGTAFYHGHDPLAVLLSWTFSPMAWMETPLIKIKNPEVRKELHLSADKTVFSYAELTRHRRLLDLIEQASRAQDRKLDALESKASKINGKLVLLQQIFAGRIIKPIPNAKDRLGQWYTIGHTAHRKEKEKEKEPNAVRAAWAAMSKAFIADDRAAFADASDKLVTALAELPAAHRPDAKIIATEIRFNQLGLFRRAWIVMIIGAVLAGIALIVRQKWFDWLAAVGLLGGFAILTYGLLLRWHIAGRIPAANMFESLLFLSWGMGAFAILSMLVQRNRIVPLTASVMGATSLMLADLTTIDSYIRPIAPVLLDTIWMSIHVPVIMISYSVLALAVLIAHVQLAVTALAPARRQLVDSIDKLHYWYIHIGAFLLIAGIITGSMWGASSWGRYWGWDPKEVWSLVAFLGYVAILHVRIDRAKVPGWAYVTAAMLAAGLFFIIGWYLDTSGLTTTLVFAAVATVMVIFVTARSQFAMALKSVLAFWLIIWTYVGVNYVMSIGLHSYGFGAAAAIVNSLVIIGTIDLAIIAACCALYFYRTAGQPPARQIPQM